MSTTLLLFVTHGALFLALKTDGDIRHRARRLAVTVGLAAAVVAVAFLVWAQSLRGDGGSLVAVRAGRAGAGWARLSRRTAGREGWALHRHLR